MPWKREFSSFAAGLFASVALACAATLAACAGLPEPYSQLDGHRYNLTPIDTYPVLIVRVDNHDTTDSPAFVELASKP